MPTPLFRFGYATNRRRDPELPTAPSILQAMSGMNIGGARRLQRSGKLRREAENCLAIAVRETQPDMAALLIDEAVRLAVRARELGGEANDAGGFGDPRDAQARRGFLLDRPSESANNADDGGENRPMVAANAAYPAWLLKRAPRSD